MTAPDQPPAGADWHEWRGGVNENLKNVHTRLGNVETKVDDLPDKIERRVNKVVKNSQAAPPPGNGQPVTFRWLTEKFLLPIVLLVASLIIAAAVNGAMGSG